MSTITPEQRAAIVEREELTLVGASPGFFRGTWPSLTALWQRRELLGLLTRRELKARYQDSSLGIVWSLFRPLAQLLIYYFAIGVLLGASRSIPDFAVFVFVGLTSWGLFAEILSLSTLSIINNAGIIKKVYQPAEVFPLSSVGNALFNFGVQLIVLIGATIVFGVAPISPRLAYAPLAFAVILTFGTAIGLLLAGLNVYFRDVQHIIDVVLITLFWASPIVYSYTYVHNALGGSWIESVYLANPVTLGILGMQKAFWIGGANATGTMEQYFPPNLPTMLFIALAASLVLLWLSQRIFTKLQKNFAQEL